MSRTPEAARARERVRAALTAQAPARFVICAENEDETLGEVLCWGLSLPDQALIGPASDGLASWLRSADRALWMYSCAQPVELIWIDQV